jgi:ADP-ribosyl-[dinitrogen reductase] hydrolase
MLGAIAGDIIGSVHEHAGTKTKTFPLFAPGVTFTDDTVCTVAVASCLLEGGDFARSLRSWGRRYPGRGYGGMFAQWLADPGMGAYGSYGNGAAMRVSPIAWLAKDESEALDLAARSAAVSHDHPDAVAGAQATVLAMWLARQGQAPAAIRSTIAARCGYDLTPSVDQIRPGYGFDISCKGTVPPALVCAFEAVDYEDAIRNAISLGGDADTLACITGGLAEALFGLPGPIAVEARARLDAPLIEVIDRFYAKIGAA